MMTWHVPMDGPWSAEAARRFRELGEDALTLVPGREWTPSNLDFLHDLEGLRSFRFTGRVSDDLAAFAVPTLEELTLITGSKRAVPPASRPNLSSLVVVDRPGLEVRPRWPGLSRLRVGLWHGADLRILAGADRLAGVYLEGRRQSGSLDGIEECAALESLTLINYSVTDLAAVRHLSMLRSIDLHAATPASPHAPLDMAELPSARLVALRITNASGLHNLDALADRPFLHSVRLVDCSLTEQDRRTLASLDRIRVEIVNR
jgi:hypothetical protein